MFNKTTLVLLLALLPFLGFSQNSGYWNEANNPNYDREDVIDYGSTIKNYQLYSLDVESIKSKLAQSPMRWEDSNSDNLIYFPTMYGETIGFNMFETQTLSETLSSKFPSIKSYVGVNPDKKSQSIRVTVSKYGVYAMIQNSDSQVFINPFTKGKDNNLFMVFDKNQAYLDAAKQMACEFKDDNFEKLENKSNEVHFFDDSTLRRYRLAQACTSEYSEYQIEAANAESDPEEDQLEAVQAAMAVTIDRVNSIYERDFSITLEFVDNNEDLIVLNSASDPYSNFNSGAMLNQNQTRVDQIIGTSNYDLGHVFSTGTGGIAALGSVCDSSNKARGVTGRPNPVGDPFDIDYVAHEMGHQFGATHTFNNACGGSRTNSTAYEPGSGNTIMGYAGICPPNVQNNSDAHFHYTSVDQIENFISFNGGTCAEEFSINNQPPSVSSPGNYVIPRNTAFALDVEATDPDGDELTYNWEQYNNDISNQPPLPNATTGPNFRSFPSSTDSKRYFPNLASILDGNLTPTWEVIPSTGRNFNFRVLVRDNNIEGGQNAGETSFVEVTFNGPFEVTSQNESGIVWEPGETVSVTWDVGGTNTGQISEEFVNVLLSTNNGESFDYVLASEATNDGQVDVIAPNINAANCRIMVEAADNIFLAVNASPFDISGDLVEDCQTSLNEEEMIIADAPDESTPGDVLISEIDIVEGVEISSMNVSLDITHDFISDLSISLEGPDGESVLLFDGNCADETGMALTFDDEGSEIPNDCPDPLTGIFSPLAGEFDQWTETNSAGVWTLVVQDNSPGDTGTLNSWEIEFCEYEEFSTSTEDAYNFSISPNPSSGSFQINLSEPSSEQTTAVIYDMRGRLIQQVDIAPNARNQRVELNNAQSGVYLVEITDGNSKTVEKLIVK
ncbi:MAG: reprolysin-like metallopeptidase [Bacteroidota bacterium]